MAAVQGRSRSETVFDPSAVDASLAALTVPGGGGASLRGSDGAKVEMDKAGATLLHHAVARNNAYAVGVLLEAGAAVDRLNYSGASPLLVACYYGYREIAHTLLQADADVYLADESGQTPLYVAASAGHTELVNLLLAHIDISHLGETMYSLHPLHVACMKGHDAIVEALIRKGVDVNVVTDTGATPLHCAALFGHTAVVDRLLNAGAKVTIKSKNGRRAVDLDITPEIAEKIRAQIPAKKALKSPSQISVRDILSDDDSDHAPDVSGAFARLLKKEDDYLHRCEEILKLVVLPLCSEQKGSPFGTGEISVAKSLMHVLDIMIKARGRLVAAVRVLSESWSEAQLMPFVELYQERLQSNSLYTMLEKYVEAVHRFLAVLHRMPDFNVEAHLDLENKLKSDDHISVHLDYVLKGTPLYAAVAEGTKRICAKAKIPDSSPGMHALDALVSSLHTLTTQAAEMHRTARNVFSCEQVEGMLVGEFDSIISPNRSLIKEGFLYRTPPKGSGSGKKQKRYFFLFSDIMLCCAPVHAKKGRDKERQYELKGRVDLLNATIRDTPDTKGERNAFQIVNKRGDWLLAADLLEEKREWVEALQHVHQKLMPEGASSDDSKRATTLAMPGSGNIARASTMGPMSPEAGKRASVLEGSATPKSRTNSVNLSSSTDDAAALEAERKETAARADAETRQQQEMIAKLQAEKEASAKLIEQLLAERRALQDAQSTAEAKARQLAAEEERRLALEEQRKLERAEAERQAAEEAARAERERVVAARKAEEDRLAAARESAAQQQRQAAKDIVKARVMGGLKTFSDHLKETTGWLTNDPFQIRDQMTRVVNAVRAVQADLHTTRLEAPSIQFVLAGKKVMEAPTSGEARASFKELGFQLAAEVRQAFIDWDQAAA